MLSSTYSIQDVRIRLSKTYTDYDFNSETEFTNAIIIALEDVQYLYMYPVLGSSAYDIIKAKDKVDLTEKENYLYLAEVYYTCSLFLERRASSISSSNSNASSEKLQVEGYTYESKTDLSEGSTASIYNAAIRDYWDKALNFMSVAGYSPYNLQRGGAMFSKDETTNIYGDIV